MSLQTDDIDGYHARLKDRGVGVDAEVSRFGATPPVRRSGSSGIHSREWASNSTLNPAANPRCRVSARAASTPGWGVVRGGGYHGDTAVAEGKIKTQLGFFAVAGGTLYVGRQPGEPVTDDYPGESPHQFTGGTLKLVTVDVSGKPFTDPEITPRCCSNTNDRGPSRLSDNATERVTMSGALQSWNDTRIRQAIVEFVEAATTEGGPGYISAAERVAVFDNDGTLWCEKPMPIELGFILHRLAEWMPRCATASRGRQPTSATTHGSAM